MQEPDLCEGSAVLFLAPDALGIVLVIVFFAIWASLWLWYLFACSLGIVLVVTFVFNLGIDLVVICLQSGHRSDCDIYLDLGIVLVVALLTIWTSFWW